MRPLLALAFVGAAALALLVGFFVVLRVVVDTDDPDCSAVALPDPARWQALGSGDRVSLVGDLSLCSELDGLTTAEVASHFGPPDAQGTQGDGSGLLVYRYSEDDPTAQDGELRLTIRDGRVADVMSVGVGDD